MALPDSAARLSPRDGASRIAGYGTTALVAMCQRGLRIGVTCVRRPVQRRNGRKRITVGESEQAEPVRGLVVAERSGGTIPLACRGTVTLESPTALETLGQPKARVPVAGARCSLEPAGSEFLVRSRGHSRVAGNPRAG